MRGAGIRRRSRTPRRSSRKVLLLAVVALALAASVGVGWLLTKGAMDEPRVANGEPVSPFQLPDLVSGRTYSLGEYLGKQEIVVVSYMGWF